MLKKLTVMACGLGLMGITAGAAAGQTTTAADTTQATSGALSDAGITSAVKTKLLESKAVGGMKIDVDTDHGVVTLTGHVKTAAERTEAVRLARATKGVTKVVNKLTLETAGTAGRVDASGKAKSDDTTIVIKDDTTPMLDKAAKKTKEAAKKTVDAVKNTDVKVKDNVPDTKVQIKDDTTPKLEKAERTAADASITSAVKTKLLGDTEVSGLKIDVDTSHGVVTLTGVVGSAAEKAEAIRLAKTTTGVKQVIDRLTVK